MISTLLITIVTEGLIALGYCLLRNKPVKSILLTSIGANILTQLFLWGVLIIFYQHYLAVLFVAEILIWVIESLALYCVPTNRLSSREAASLSLAMNLSSIVLGWWLPV